MILWDIARTSAFVAFACYTLTVTWGILLSARAWRPPAPQLELHRFFASLGLMAVATHVAALMADSYSHVHARTLIGLGAKPGVLAGVAAMWLVIALPLSFRLKKAKWLSHRAWRGLHYFGYSVWVLGLIHGLATGSDSRSHYALAAYAWSAGLVAGAAWWRWVEAPPRLKAVPKAMPMRPAEEREAA
ncbi:MAG: hypothetical protein ACXVY5_05615 [Gaiellales bacterium]